MILVSDLLLLSQTFPRCLAPYYLRRLLHHELRDVNYLLAFPLQDDRLPGGLVGGLLRGRRHRDRGRDGGRVLQTLEQQLVPPEGRLEGHFLRRRRGDFLLSGGRRDALALPVQQIVLGEERPLVLFLEGEQHGIEALDPLPDVARLGVAALHLADDAEHHKDVGQVVESS